jgi:DNA-binding beta-propeller fold protein YncE
MASESLVIEVNETPHSVAVSRDGAQVFVTHFRTGTVTVLDAAGSTIEKSLKVQSDPGPYGVATHPDGSIYVADNSRDFVRRVDPATGEIGPDAGIGVRPYGLAMNHAGSLLFAACPLDDCIEVLDAGIKNMFRLRFGDFCVGVAVSADGATLYATNYFSNTVSIIDISTLDAAISGGEVIGDAAVTHTVRVAEGPYGVALSPDGHRLYVAHFGSKHVVSVIDIDSGAVIDTIGATHGMVRGVGAVGDRLYVTNYFAGSVSVIDI